MAYQLDIFLAICIGGEAFFLWFLVALCRDKKGPIGVAYDARKRQSNRLRTRQRILIRVHQSAHRSLREQQKARSLFIATVVVLLVLSALGRPVWAQPSESTTAGSVTQADRIEKLEGEVVELKAMVKQLQSAQLAT